MRMVLDGWGGFLGFEVEGEGDADGVGEGVAAETGSGYEVGEVELHDAVFESETKGEVLTAAFGVAFVEVSGAGGEGLLVPVFATSRDLHFLEFLAETARSIVEGLDGSFHHTGAVVFGHVAVVFAVGAVAFGNRGCGDK